ncbi:ABC transporter ATP-binding protein [Geodermatophilus obscurus]|uniref:ABC transporter related protein n=1 Tax=Geodermatophilus obscurus (strain ATCC 25078 / DSM 43160 / JCM 3152 / CCUG 61914 / KCC A-0152 / KCTC 9177 / NBRC 13315 / NRRL B-3577 / G-20) TaxID=526225 RepID=D2S435_GEOOG|nr:ABC transporter ATP-binding protein [Geodermatophilus obscurus]ADB73063.1 ABC transporter related protein [Geodermatophilus obscurus DSM 43160]
MDTGGAQRSADPAVQVTDLVKRYPGRPVNAVDGISFAVERGEVFGLLGPNGAGKTTTIGVLTTRVLPTSGAASVAGVDVAADPVTARSRLSVVPQRPNLDRALTARQNLVFHAAYHGVGRAERNRRADALLEQLGLGGRGGDKVDDYSGGMAQRLLIARALMHAPQVVFLDEPSTGLDPQARLFVWDRVRELRDGGITVLLTTHDMDEAATLSDRVGIMDSGRLLALDTPAALTRSLPGSATLDIDVERAPEDSDEAVLAALAPLVERVEQVADGSGLRARLYLSGDAAALVGPVSEALNGRRARLTGVRIGEPSLEDVFLSLTGRELR